MSTLKDNRKVFRKSASANSGKRAERAMKTVSSADRAQLDAEKNFALHTVVLTKIAGLLSQDGPLNELLEAALEAIAELPCLPADSSTAVFLYDRRDEILIRCAEKNFPYALAERCKRVALCECLCGHGARERQAVLAEQSDGRHTVHCCGMQPHGHYCVPIPPQGSLTGLLVLLLPSGHRPDPVEEEVLRAVSHSLAGLITGKQRIESEARLRHRMEMLWELSQLAETDFDAASQTILDELLEMTQSKYGFLGLIDKNKALLHDVKFSHGAMLDCTMENSVFEFPIPRDGLWAEVIDSGRPLIINDYSKTHHAKKHLPRGHVAISRLLAVPVSHSGRNAVLAMVANKPTGYTSRDLHEMSTFLKTVQPILQRHRDEIEKRHTEQLFRFMLGGIEDYALVLSDSGGCIVSWSAGAEKITGYGRDEIVGKHISIFYPFDAVQEGKPQRVLEEAVAYGSFREQGVRLRKDGTPFWADVNVTPVRNQHGNIEGFASLVRDITEEKKSEELEDRIAQIKDDLIRALQDISRNRDVEHLLARFLSSALELTGMPHGVIFTAENGEPKELILEKRQGESAAASCRLFFRELTRIFLNAERDAGWIDSYADPAIRSLVEKESIPYRQFFVLPLHYGDEPVGFLYLFGNREAKPLAFPDPTILEMLAAHAAIAVNNARFYDEVRSFNERLQWEVRQRTRELEIANQSLKDANVRITKNNETVQRLNRELKQVSHAKSRFLANMSHELRTPLNSVLGFSQVLLKEYFGSLNRKQKEYLNDIFESGSHLLSLINDVLDLAKIEAGKEELELSEVSLVDVIMGSMAVIKEKALKHRFDVQTEMAPEITDLMITTDHRKIKQVLYNLLSNAANYTPDGGSIKITAALVDNEAFAERALPASPLNTVTEGEKTKSRKCVLISIADSGMGIDPAEQEKIFDSFYRSAQAKTNKGTGLGLSLTRELVHLLGGWIWVESEGRNRGSCFRFVLPLPGGQSAE